MNDLREELDRSIGDVPVSRVDVDRTMVRMRRKVAWRRASSVALAAVVVAGISFAAIQLRPVHSGQIALPQETPSATATKETEQELAGRLNTVFQRKLHELLEPQAWYGFGVVLFRPGQVPKDAPWVYLRAQGDVIDSRGNGHLEVIIGRSQDAPDAGVYCLASKTVVAELQQCPGHTGAPVGKALYVLESCKDFTEGDTIRPDCEQRTGPHGEKIFVLATFQVDGARLIQRIEVHRLDGTNVVVNSSNFPEIGDTSRPQPILSIDQMIDLATAPGLSVQ